MKNYLSAALLIAASLSALHGTAAQAPDSKVIVGYVTSWTDVMPDPSTLTHINYAFGLVNDTFDGVNISNPERLRAIAALKKDAPELNVMLSVGGWGAGNFSEMAADAKLRARFAADCARIVKDYNLDGIDIDWEYPTSNAAGISSSPDDTANFTLLMRDLRDALGDDKFLTIATSADAHYIDYASCVPYLDFVNIMTYDMADAPRHHAALFSSENTPEVTCDESVRRHIKAGVPAGKLVMGVPFYGRGNKDFRGRGFRDIKEGNGYSIVFDNEAKATFLTDSTGLPVLGFDDERSMGYKCDYILEKDLLGAMYWDYSGDDDLGTLRNTLARNLKGKHHKKRILVLNEGGGQHGPFTERAMKWLKGYADMHGLAITELNNANPVSKDFLKSYDLVVQLDFPPYTWPEAAQEAFKEYIDNGLGGWIGFHHATLLGDFDGYPIWDWFSDFMGGIKFHNYIAPLATGTVAVEMPSHPVMEGVDASFALPDDEWYTYDRSPRPNVTVLASVDEDSYTPASDIRMGDHPVVWINPGKKARNVYFQPGHSPRLFESADFCRMFANAIRWAMESEENE